MASSESISPKIDHIIILLPHSVLVNLPSSFSKAFYVLPGGRHTDNLTENKLVLFKDGSYLELIAFIDDEIGAPTPNRKGHRWGSKDYGVIDFAYTFPSESDPLARFEEVQARLTSGIKYVEPEAGGRILPSGEEIAWFVAFLPSVLPRGVAPFWCFDRTPRQLRVPNQVDTYTIHPSGAVGVASVHSSVAEQLIGKAKDVLTGVHGKDGEEKDSVWSWEGDALAKQAGKAPVISLSKSEDGAKESDVFIKFNLYTQGTSGDSSPIEVDFGQGKGFKISLEPI